MSKPGRIRSGFLIQPARWQALAKPARKLRVGDVVRFGEEGRACFLSELDATVEAKGEAGEVTLGFAFAGPVLDQAIAERGAMPRGCWWCGRVRGAAAARSNARIA